MNKTISHGAYITIQLIMMCALILFWVVLWASVA